MRAVRIEEGRTAFGRDAANYDAARPDYPARIYDILATRCGLKPGVAVFEIGPGTGIATRHLLAAGADPLVAVEPDARLSAVLLARSPSPRLQVVNEIFERADLPRASFDLGVAATSFHWMEQRPALAKVAALLKPGGWWAMWWNVFGDPDRPDPFHEATAELLAGFSTPASPATKVEFGLQQEDRRADLDSVALLEAIEVDFERWTLVLDAARVRALYATYSNLTPLPEAERERVLDRLAEIAATEFSGRVERNMVTALYTGRRHAG